MEENDIRKVFASLEQKEPRKELFSAVFSLIERKRIASQRMRVTIFSASFIASFSALLFSLSAFQNEWNMSGSYQFLSLAFSDLGTVVLYWKEFLLSVTESLPVLSISAVLASLFALLTSLKYLAEDMGKRVEYRKV